MGAITGKRGREGSKSVLALDPGKRTGWCEFVVEGDISHVLGQGIVHIDSFDDFLDTKEHVDLIVFEQYIVRAAAAQYHTGSTVEAAQVIGKIHSFAKRNEIREKVQFASILPLAMKLVGMTKPKGHLPDNISAWLHGVWFLHQIGKYKSALERTGS